MILGAFVDLVVVVVGPVRIGVRRHQRAVSTQIDRLESKST
jgi:hypothetical protein